MEAGVKLIAKAWEVPRESLQASLELIERERQLLRSGSSEDALPNSELLKPYDGKMIAALSWASSSLAVVSNRPQSSSAIILPS